jgi:hypothetical protein
LEEQKETTHTDIDDAETKAAEFDQTGE